MVQKRTQLRTFAYAYMSKRGDSDEKKSIERWVSVHATKVEGWFVGKSQLDDLICALMTERPVDYVLIHEAGGISRAIVKQIETAGAKVIYTSRGV